MQEAVLVRTIDVHTRIRFNSVGGGSIRVEFTSPTWKVQPVQWLLGPGPVDDQVHEEIDTVVLAMLDTALAKTFGKQLNLF